MNPVLSLVTAAVVAMLVFVATAKRYGCEKPRRGVFDAALALLGVLYLRHQAQVSSENAYLWAAAVCGGFAIGAIFAVMFGERAVRSGFLQRRQ